MEQVPNFQSPKLLKAHQGFRAYFFFFPFRPFLQVIGDGTVTALSSKSLNVEGGLEATSISREISDKTDREHEFEHMPK